ncbi:MAG: HDIG domain-containing protein [Bacteroidia bacterium]|nr:HDIG domain-containing protein [Bacteroidia bacterium]MCX7651875.1 HDIG domain-containing protein [Bacteroidia bacterium]MDW8416026.1 HDIG domain-containing protein [Bacteroidia bacterium]
MTPESSNGSAKKLKKSFSVTGSLRKYPLIWTALLALLYSAGISAFIGWWSRPVFLTPYKEGDVWMHTDLFAPFEFRVFKSSEDAAQEVDSLIQRYSLVFRKDTSIQVQVQRRIDSLCRVLPTSLHSPLRDAFRYAYRYGYSTLPLTGQRGTAILRLSPQDEYQVSAEALVDSVKLWTWLRAQYGEALANELQPYLRSVFQPNLDIDPQAAGEKLRQATKSLSPYTGTIKKGELIVRKGELISSDIQQKLNSLRTAHETIHPFQSRLTSFLGLFLLISIITFITLWYLLLAKKIAPHNLRPVALLFSVYIFITLIIAGLNHSHIEPVQGINIPLHHLFPFAIGPIILAIFFDDRVGFISAITLGAQISLIMEEPVEYFFIHGFSSMLAVFRLRVLQRRSHLYYALATLLIGYILTYSGYHLFRQGYISLISWTGIPLLTANAVLCLLAYPLIYGIERVFRLSSDITFLELLDTNHPLLQELKRRAPGTYQHSLSVAALAEAAAEKIGAHPLKAHVMALFHDVGKLENPKYFVENLSTISLVNAINPHHNLTPQESASIIKAHVPTGVKLAKQARLPDEVISGIQTHHGTTYIQYFWEKQKRQCPQEAAALEVNFRYDGPLPQTKEEAILMLADSLEASTRAIPNLTPEKLRQHIRTIIQQRIAEGQLREASLTFAQLSELEVCFYEQLLSIHHARIQYPEPSVEVAAKS